MTYKKDVVISNFIDYLSLTSYLHGCAADQCATNRSPFVCTDCMLLTTDVVSVQTVETMPVVS